MPNRRSIPAVTLLLVVLAPVAHADETAGNVAFEKKRDQIRATKQTDEIQDTLDRWRAWLNEHELIVGVDVAFYNQYASHVREGGNNAATFAWQLFADYEVAKTRHGEFHLAGTFFGTIGADYNPATDSLSDRIGSISIVNGNVYPDGIAFDELYAHYISPNAELILTLGKVDMSYFFDTNRVANDAYRQFTAYALENDISIPFPTYGGFGALARWTPRDDLYILFGAGDASSNERIPWGSVTDGAWWELIEAGWTVEPSWIGEGNYRVTAWHSDRGPGNGFGVGLNLDQNLGADWIVGFARAGFGDQSQTDIQTAVSAGLGFQEPFGRSGDEAGVGVAWANPSGPARVETYIETYYRAALTSRLSISPALQVVLDPTLNAQDDLSVIGEIRLLWML